MNFFVLEIEGVWANFNNTKEKNDRVVFPPFDFSFAFFFKSGEMKSITYDIRCASVGGMPLKRFILFEITVILFNFIFLFLFHEFLANFHVSHKPKYLRMITDDKKWL